MQEGETVDTAIGAYLDDLAIGRSPETVRTYRSALTRFQQFLQSDDKDKKAFPLSDLTIDHALGFARSLGRGEANQHKASLYSYTTAVSQFYAYLVREKKRPDLPLADMQLRLRSLRGRPPRRLPNVPADDTIRKLVEAVHKQPPGHDERAELIRLRNIALIETLRGSGVRVSELVSLRRADLDRETRSARITGKGAKQRTIYLTRDAIRAIDTYLQARRDGGGGRNLAGLPVFARHDPGAGKTPKALTTRSVRNVVYDLIVSAGLEELTVTPHRFRAWFATYLVEKTGDLAAVQDLLGHESANTTRVYTKVRAGRLRSIHEHAFEDDVDTAEQEK